MGNIESMLIQLHILRQQISGLQNLIYDIYVMYNRCGIISRLIKVGCHWDHQPKVIKVLKCVTNCSQSNFVINFVGQFFSREQLSLGSHVNPTNGRLISLAAPLLISIKQSHSHSAAGQDFMQPHCWRRDNTGFVNESVYHHGQLW